MKIESVFVASDLSEAADEAIRVGDRWASREGARLTIGFVLPALVAQNPLFPQAAIFDTAKLIELERRAAEELEDRVVAITGRDANARHISVTIGTAVRGILDAAATAKADLLVVGPDADDGATVAERVARLAPCPVLVARKGGASGGVIVGTDLSERSFTAVREAFDIARRHEQPIAIAHVIETPQGPLAKMFAFVGQPVPHPENRVPGARARIQTWLEKERQSGPSDVPAPEIVVVEGEMAPSLTALARSRHAGLVVIGTRGWTTDAELPLGSSAEELLRTARASVLVIRL